MYWLLQLTKGAKSLVSPLILITPKNILTQNDSHRPFKIELTHIIACHSSLLSGVYLQWSHLSSWLINVFFHFILIVWCVVTMVTFVLLPGINVFFPFIYTVQCVFTVVTFDLMTLINVFLPFILTVWCVITMVTFAFMPSF